MTSRLVSLLVLALLTAACADTRTDTTAVPTERRTVHVEWTPIQVRMATTPEQRKQGLMGVSALADDEGMLFVYPDEALRTIWMKNCRMALDVAFADRTGRIFQVVTLQPPTATDGQVEQVWSDREAMYVLEMEAGWFQRRSLGVGNAIYLTDKR